MNIVGKDMEKLETWYIVHGNVNPVSAEDSKEVPQKIKNRIPYDLAILLLSIYPKLLKLEYLSDIRTPMFIAAIFTIVNIWQQPKCH